ncbi:hypothetical protein NEUTE1DRAFT_132296 [Neurospora tetrasperma FGSC 2508]|uniref:Uncharacterized protein n=1 Tax=Neurospora tetrasperma (strain FGSC 2508 / ATCC MYA-4615 / P0657) TaxID=510951 RepID=F8MXW2_NEUT8|nr:uncharacterized protein NEUTE1DRAFT_132296 [Neurospora tetrasperma FGSC 2508]EGO53862.1 hypothetical protein NEUTE1DRAFT_132296 [Neurospora tetrasperma FGSC 2508]EGZ69884.1 hypothetical protein NEUTE2DRAFT_118893 [Neurospora tetrasperma FGSC 2509]
MDDALTVMNLFSTTNMGLVGRSQIDPAILVALFGIAQVIGAPISTLSTPKQDVNVITLQNKLNTAGTQLREIQDSLNPIVYQCGKDVIDKLEMAMTKLYRLAVFIRGDYDNREPDTTQRDELLKQAVQAFKEVEDRAQGGLEKVGQLHAQVMEIENMVINPAKQDIDLLLENNDNELKNVQGQINNAEKSFSVLQDSVKKQSQAVSRLHDKISSSQDAKLASDIFFSIITLGIGNAINKGPLDPFNLQRELDEANRLLKDAQRKYNEAANELDKLRVKRMTLDTRLSAAKQTAALIPGVSTLADTTNTNCIMLQHRFGPLKQRSAQLLLSVGKIQSDATVTKALAYSKKEFAVGLLEICRDSLMDQALLDEATMIRDEVMNEYGAAIPDEVQEMASETSERMSLVTTVPSIRA